MSQPDEPARRDYSGRHYRRAGAGFGDGLVRDMSEKPVC